MLRLLMHFIDRSEEALKAGATPEQIARAPVLRRLRRLGEELKEDDPEEANRLWAEIDSELAGLQQGDDDDAR